MQLKYKPDGEQLKRFLKSNNFFSGIMGPVGSGKTAAGCIKILRHSLEQQPSTVDGIRRTRWAVVRNTNPQLKTTTIKTWLQWFPEETFGKFSWDIPYTHRIRFADVDMEVIFLAMDRAEDVRKLLSLELTGIFFNEARELPKAVIDDGTSRCGRFPQMIEGGPTWYGGFADTNAPDDEHWWPIMGGYVSPPEYMQEAEKKLLVRPEGWEFFRQPPGMIEIKDAKGEIVGYELNPKRENAKYQVEGYYEKIIAGKTQAWVDIYILNKFGSTEAGKPVYPNYLARTHLLGMPPDLDASMTFYAGMDFGLTPACVWGARDDWMRYTLFKELIAQDMDIATFAKLVAQQNRILHEEWGIKMALICGDPSGDSRKDVNIETVYQILAANGVKAVKAPTNDPVIRVGAVNELLTSTMGGLPRLMVSPECKVVARGFDGGYKYRRLKVSGEARYEDTPLKNKYSHPHDAVQYLVLGAGEGALLLHNANQNSEAAQMQRRDNVLQRRSGIRSRRGKRSLNISGI